MLKHIDCFNKAAPTYDKQSSLQCRVGDQLITYLQELPKQARIIDLGCGTGLVTEQLAKRIAHQELIALDLAERLLMIAEKRLKLFDVDIQLADFDTLTTSIPYDIVFSNMALHWSNHFSNTLRLIKTALASQGYLAFSVPLLNTFHELKPYFAIHRFMHHDNVLQHLREHHYHIQAAQQETISIKFPGTLSALRSLKQTGVNFCPQRTTKSLKKMTFPDSVNTLTYHIGYYVAQNIP